MIDITPFQEKLQWLNEFMIEQIKLKGLWYGFRQWIWIDGDPKTYDMSNFDDFCYVKKRDRTINEFI